ncbi:MAG: rhodanese-like domain-containing protein [Gammaproteobacteria bacterium]|nr:rhodanese-like domain-containing protein [Gammaproteobacteria bacterium]
MSQVISREELQALIASGAQHSVIEALPSNYYQAEHLPGAINIPHDAVPATAGRLVPDKSAPVVVYCANTECRNSHVAAEALRQLGYHRVYEYTEGKQGWKQAGLPLESGKGAL